MRLSSRYGNSRQTGAMTEIEIKILGINRAAVETALIARGATKCFDGEIHAIYYDLPDQSLRASGMVLRLRREGMRTVLTLKEHVENPRAKERREREVEVLDFDAMRSVLELIGLAPWLEMKKHRTSYLLKGTRFELDKYHGSYSHIPEFLEIEGTDTETVYRYAEDLGFSRLDCKPWDATELAAYYTGREKTQ